MSIHGNEFYVISMLAPHLEDSDDYVRIATVQALATVAKKGDQNVIAAVSLRLEDPDANVRSAAAQALSSMTAETET